MDIFSLCRLTRLTGAVGVLIFLLVVYSVGNAQSAINPCEIINLEEASAIMGEPMRPGKMSEQQAVSMKLCLYEAVDDLSPQMLQISIHLGENAHDIFTAIAENFPDNEPVQSIGDEAFIATPGMHLMVNGKYLTIAAGNLRLNREKVMEAAKKAAQNYAAKEQ